ncbi:MAG: fused MFS/spermidine synthase [Acidobacteria bacterium]|jgi:spermidine synthase|nr:fused MFS/spermidine synthase [Acidobacteriota bacterium]
MLRVIPLAYGSLGAFTIVVQAILLREFFMVSAGNEVSFAIAMAGWLLGVGAGSLAGAFVSRRRQGTALPFSWAAMGLCLAAPLLLAAVRSLHAIGAMPQGMPLPLARSLYLVPLLSLPFCALSGFAFPLAARLAPRLAAREKRAAGAIASAFAWESFGAMAGGAIYTFLLLERLAPLPIIVLFALPLLAAAGCISWRAGGKRTAGAAFLALILSLAAFAGGTAARCDSRLALKRWLGISSARLVAARDTRFQNLQLGLDRGQYSLFANGQLSAIFPDDEGYELLAAQLLSQHPRPRHILVIGDVAAGLAKHLLRYPLASLTAVEIDAGMTAMIRGHLDAAGRRALDDPRLSLRILDGRRYVLQAAQEKEGSRRRFDLVFIHQPDAWTAQINRYYTREFFQDLRGILAPDGVLALRLASAENYASEIVIPYTAAIYKTLESVFPAIAISPGMTNFFFASAARSSVSQNAAVLARRYQALAPAGGLAPAFASLYPPEKSAYIRAALRRSRIPSLNLDDRPVAYYFGSRLLGWSTGSSLPELFDRFQDVTFFTILTALALLLLPLLLASILGRGRGMAAPVLAAACAGFAGLAFEVTAIFIFQNTWGFVYQAIGLLIAIYMLGLGAGAAWTSAGIRKIDPSPHRAARILAGVLLLFSLIVLAFLLLRPVYWKGAGQFLLAAWLGGAGLLAGAVLPLGMRVLDRLPEGRSAGFLNAGDYLGGAAGSMLTAAFFLPLLGTGRSLALICSIALAAAVALAFAARSAGKRE